MSSPDPTGTGATPPPIDLTSDAYFMGEALRQARLAYEAEEVPVGAVIVHNQRIIARAFNQVELLKDATAHAEILALTQAAQAFGDWRLEGTTLFATKEPCPMCAGALTLARVQRLVYGVRDERAGGAGSVYTITATPGWYHRVVVTGGVRGPEARALLQEFFRARRLES
ncbi:nucleoside deaminase [bacterium]|nr:nucleoside deaminase [bacterium]